MVTSTLASRFKILREGLRRELTNRGHQVTYYFEQMDGRTLNVNFQNNADDTITVYWGPKGDRHKLVDPDSRTLADAILKTFGEKHEPPQPIKTPQRPQQTQPQSRPQQTAAKPKPKQAPATGGVFITEADYAELQKLRAMAAHGIWIAKDAYAAMQQEMKAGYIPPDARKEINARFDRLLRRMSCE